MRTLLQLASLAFVVMPERTTWFTGSARGLRAGLLYHSRRRAPDHLRDWADLLHPDKLF